MRLYKSALAIVAVIVTIVFGPLIATGSASTSQQAPAGWLKLPSNLPSNWRTLSVQELAKYGIHANAGGLSANRVAPAVGTSAPPPSHYGCNGATCINVVGTGLTVNSWTTTSHATYRTTFAIYTYNGTFYASGPNETGTNFYDDISQDGWGITYPLHLPNGTVLCNQWSGISGYPCATVHS